ncbi:hypothetical protein LQR31_17220 [Chromobacterium vaccinii]|uniref:Uncharacterized protein n=2 Tax=Chromobacterium TaxID=535 RepID=A0ABV0FDX7_9NEIS|nr:hypothetical protein [Chromobacterium vaccinii]MCD4486214.1 hypothetical protein [Chromobacterium vaccinii]MCD4499258.1 hypothetical protein [Chromobacterium vaccinii]
MLKTLVVTALALLTLSGSVMAGDGLSVMWAMRGRMDAQLHGQPAPMIPQNNSIPSDG